MGPPTIVWCNNYAFNQSTMLN